MGVNTKIQWCDHTANFWWGCQKVAQGCTNCYAETFARRVGNDIWGKNKPRRFIKSTIGEVRKWNEKAKQVGERRRVFVNSMSDFFEDHAGGIINYKGIELYTRGDDEEPVPFDDGKTVMGRFRSLTLDDLRHRAFELFRECQWLDFLLLTKRPENIRKMWCNDPDATLPQDVSFCQGYPNVWLGTSFSTQDEVERNVPLLLECRDLTPVLFVSAEPLIQYVDISKYNELDWLIVGGESGHGARRFEEIWALSIAAKRQPSQSFFMKQLGSNGGIPNLKDSKGGDPEEWPEYLRIREFP